MALFGSLHILGAYALLVIIAQVSFQMVDATGIFPVSISINGVDTTELSSQIQSDTREIFAIFTGDIGMDTITGVWLFPWEFFQFIAQFFILAFTGIRSLLIAIGIDTEIATSIQLLVLTACVIDIAARKS